MAGFVGLLPVLVAFQFLLLILLYYRLANKSGDDDNDNDDDAQSSSSLSLRSRTLNPANPGPQTLAALSRQLDLLTYWRSSGRKRIFMHFLLKKRIGW